MKIPRIIKHPNLGSLDDTGFIGVQRMSKKRRAVYEKLTNDFFRAYCEKQVTLGKPEVMAAGTALRVPQAPGTCRKVDFLTFEF